MIIQLFVTVSSHKLNWVGKEHFVIYVGVEVRTSDTSLIHLEDEFLTTILITTVSFYPAQDIDFYSCA